MDPDRFFKERDSQTDTMTPTDWLTVLLYDPAADEPLSLSPIQLTNGLFLLTLNLRPRIQSYRFQRLWATPFSSELHDDLRAAILRHVIRKVTTSRGFRHYQLTPAGLARGRVLYAELQQEMRDTLDGIRVLVKTKNPFRLERELNEYEMETRRRRIRERFRWSLRRGRERRERH